MDKRHTDFLIRISCNKKSVNLWRGAFLPKGGLFSLGRNARGGISAWAKMPGEAFLPGGHFRLLQGHSTPTYPLCKFNNSVVADMYCAPRSTEEGIPGCLFVAIRPPAPRDFSHTVMWSFCLNLRLKSTAVSEPVKPAPMTKTRRVDSISCWEIMNDNARKFALTGLVPYASDKSHFM